MVALHREVPHGKFLDRKAAKIGLALLLYLRNFLRTRIFGA